MIGRRPKHSLPLGFGRFGLRVDSVFCPTWFWVLASRPNALCRDWPNMQPDFDTRSSTLLGLRVLGASTCELTAPSALLVLGVWPLSRHALCLERLADKLSSFYLVLVLGHWLTAASTYSGVGCLATWPTRPLPGRALTTEWAHSPYLRTGFRYTAGPSPC